MQFLLRPPNITLTDQKHLDDKDRCGMWSGIWGQGYSQECRRSQYVPLTSAWFHPRHVLLALLVGNLLGVSDCNNYWGWFHVFILETPLNLLTTKHNLKVVQFLHSWTKPFSSGTSTPRLPRNPSAWGSGFGRCTRLLIFVHQTFYWSTTLLTFVRQTFYLSTSLFLHQTFSLLC